MSENAIMAIDKIYDNDNRMTICSIANPGNDRDVAKKIYNASTNPTHKLADCINQTINISDVYIEFVDVLKDENTGELENVPRIILIEQDGTSYQCVSKGIFNSVKQLIAAFGSPTWEPALTLTVKQQRVGRGNMLTLAAE